MLFLHSMSIILLIIISIYYKIRIVDGGCDFVNALGLSPTVQLTKGPVQGLKCVSALGHPYFSFRSLRYAAPPLGNLRFRAPQPLASWKGVLNATVEAPACPQTTKLYKIPYPIYYSEDCLFLNVFTPYLKHSSGKALPVLVYIYGGNFYKGSGNSYKYGPDFFLQKEVILVTFNYRLGVFGNLNMNIMEAQGNAAMKDTVEVLRWVKREISNFGGDPNLVTIFGTSSGATAVGLLYMSPMARGLFSRAISQSGATALAPSTYEFGLQLARAFNCTATTPQGIVACLRAVDAEELAEQQMMFWGVHGLECPFLPNLEEDHGEEVFLSSESRAFIAHTPPIPYLMGVNNGEGLMFISDPEETPNEFENTTDLVVKYLPVKISENVSPSVTQESVHQIDKFYFRNSSSLIDTVYGFVNYTSDVQVIYDVLKAAKEISMRVPVYLYYFTFEGEFQAKDHNYYKLNFSDSGVCHGEELGYFFYRNYTLLQQNNLTAYPRDMKMVDTITTLWTNFATYGNPTPFQPKESNSSWLPMKGEVTQYFQIGNITNTVRHPLLEKRMSFWDDLYHIVFSKQKKAIGTTILMSTVSCIPLLCIIMSSIAFVKNYIQHKDYISWK